MSQSNWILYVDDDADDRFLLEESFRGLNAPDKKLLTVADGVAALEFLEQQAPSYPCLLILDLNMPGLNGKELARRMRSHPEYRKIPVVIFTTSASPHDRREFEHMGIDMVTKPVDLDDFGRTAALLVSYCQ